MGQPRAAHRSADGAVIAFVSDFGPLYWPARALYDGHHLRYRVSLYSSDLRERLGVFDGAAFPINDIAFHPTLPLLALATGKYDGGYRFEGALQLWNWDTGESVHVLAESREVARVRFTDQGTLVILLRPRHEEEFEAKPGSEVFVGGTLSDLRSYHELGLRAGDTDPRVAGFTPVDPAVLRFDGSASASELRADECNDLLAASGVEPRRPVWDIVWSDTGQVLAVHDGCHVEAWEPDGRRAFQLHGPGRGIQLLSSPEGTFVHVLERIERASPPAQRSKLFRLRGAQLAEVAAFEGAMLFSTDRAGRLLCRDTGDITRRRKRIDRVLDAHGRELLARNLGHYDCFNHHLRLDGQDALYFLRGTPPTSHEHKVLCRIDAAQRIVECFTWDADNHHLMGNTACFLPDGSLARAYRVYHPSNFTGFIEVLELPSGKRRWRRSVSALATCLTSHEQEPWLFYALTDGLLGVLDWRTGEPLAEHPLRVGDVDTVALCMAPQRDRLACGTLDGRVLLLRAAARPT